MFSTPIVFPNVTVPPKLLAPATFTVPVPNFAKLLVAPPAIPDANITVFDCGSKETVTPSATTKRRERSTVFPTAHCNVALPDTVTGPSVPKPPEPKLNVPADKTVPPAYVLFPDNTNVPAPAFVKEYIGSVAEITPPTVNELAATVTVRDPVKLTDPVPTFNVFDPT
jgi:hypothetical protein